MALYSEAAHQVIQRQLRLARRVRNASLVAAAVAVAVSLAVGLKAQFVIAVPALALALGLGVLLFRAAQIALQERFLVLTTGVLDRRSNPAAYWCCVASLFLAPVFIVAIAIWFAGQLV